MNSKQEIRNKFKHLRDRLSEREAAVLSKKISTCILQSDFFDEADTLFAYYPLGNEVDVRPVIVAALVAGKTVALPKVFGETMRFLAVRDMSQLEKGCFGVMEPTADCPEVSPFDESEKCKNLGCVLVLTPGVAFDRTGNRMGFGKGYYDRYFAKKAECVRLGVCYDVQIAEELPTDAYDVPLPYLVTEDGLFRTTCREEDR